jgi:hypothetical protein
MGLVTLSILLIFVKGGGGTKPPSGAGEGEEELEEI